MPITLDQPMLIHQRAIDKKVGAGEGAAWWREMQIELEAVIAAPTTAAAAEIIAWWYYVWAVDTPARASGKIRRHAASVLGKLRKMMSMIKNAVLLRNYSVYVGRLLGGSV